MEPIEQAGRRRASTRHGARSIALLLTAFAMTAVGCGGDASPPPTSASAASADSAPAAPPSSSPAVSEQASAADDAETPLPGESIESSLPPAVRDQLLKPFTGDVDGMAARRLVRVGVTYNRTFYFIDRGVQRGVAYDYGQLLEQRINTHYKTGIDDKIHVVFVPMPRNQLFQALVDGRVDLVSAQITIRPDLREQVAFSNPTRSRVNQVVVTGPGVPSLASVGDLSGRDVYVRPRSAYHESLVALNAKLAAERKSPVSIREVPEDLEDDDLLEMVNAGLLPAIVVDDYIASFWKQVLPNLTVHDDVVVHAGGELGVALRKGNPKALAALNSFMGKYGLGTAFGNQIERKYLVSTKFVKGATSEAERRKFQDLVTFFQKYGGQYSLDYLLMAAQGYQESRLDQGARSQVGAIGVMQVMPATGRELKVGDIHQTEANIHAGVKYIRFMMDRYYKDEPMDTLNKALFTFASYNAGPARVRQLRRAAEKEGLNPNVWFGNVERIASERIGRETVTYVANIYKYYVAYKLYLEQAQRREAARARVGG